MTVEEDLALASAVIGGIRELFSLYEAAKGGTVSAADALQSAQLFTDRIAANKAAAMKALDEKFPKEG